MADRVLAAVMPAPRTPVEVREFAAPDLPPGGALLRTAFSEVCGTDVHLWHGRLAGVPYPIIPGPCLGRHARAVRGTARRRSTARPFAKAIASCSSTCIARAAAAARARSHRTPTRCRRAPRLRHHRSGQRGSVRRMGAKPSTSSPAWASHGCPTRVTFEDYIGGGCGLITAVHIIERAALRPGDRVLVQGTGAVGLSTIALARLAGASRDRRDRRARTIGSRSRAGWAQTRCSTSDRRRRRAARARPRVDRWRAAPTS